MIASTIERRETRENGRETRRRMLRAAAQLIAENGDPAVTISAVSEMAGITRRAAYHHFASRDELLAAVREDLNEQLFKSLEGRQDYLEPRHLLVALAEEDETVLKFHIFEMLNRGLQDNIIYQKICTSLKQQQKQGLIKPEIDIEMFALISMSAAFFGAVNAMSLAKTKTERHRIAQRFLKELERSIRQGSHQDPK